MTSRTLPLRKITVSTRSGDDPDAIDDASEVYGDGPGDALPFDIQDRSEPCPRNPKPNGQCEYDWRDKWTACVHCKRESGL